MGRPKGSKNKLKKDLTKTPERDIVQDIGKYVQYYQDGLRVGTLLSITKGLIAVIRPIPPIGGAQPHDVKVPLADVKRIEANE